MSATLTTKTSSKNSIVLGLGNTLRGDDAIGILIAEELAKKFSSRACFICTEEMGLSLLDYLEGFAHAVIIDSIVTGDKPTGSLHLFSLEDFSPQLARSNHYIGIPELACVAEKLSIPFPKRVDIIGIEVENPYDITTSLTPTLQGHVPQILTQVTDFLRDHLPPKRDDAKGG